MVDREQVLHVARLAKLRLAEGEIDLVAGQLGRILEYVEMLGELDDEAADAAPPARLEPGPPRADELRESLDRSVAMGLAPKTDGETFLVPPVIEGSGGA